MDLQEKRLREIEYQIKRFKERLIKLEKKGRSLGNLRAAIFLSGLIIFFISFFFLKIIFVISIAAVFLIVSGILTKFHNNLDSGVKRHKIWIDIKTINAARIKIDWKSLPPEKNLTLSHNHPFEFDLNISGEYSLHRLIDSSVTKEGNLKLLEWLTEKVPSLDKIVWRQDLIKELIPLSKFRDKLQLISNLITKKELYGERLLSWIQEKSNAGQIKKVIVSLLFVIPLNVVLILLAISGIANSIWIFTLSLLLAINYFNSKYIKGLFDRSLILDEDIGKFYLIFKFLEEYAYGKNKHLKELCSSFLTSGKTPSSYFKRINRLIFFASFQKNPLIRIILNVLFPWDFYQAYRLENIKTDLAREIPAWLEAWNILEALISLANFAYLNPSYNFPEIKNSSIDKTTLNAVNIGHPLIPFQKNVLNNFNINEIGEVEIITGSNMSGKSTFLKTIGLNLVLAFAGSVVNAEKFNTNLFRVFTSINITDSVVDGISYFYAEVKRLKDLLIELNKDAAVPLFFLIDEIFKGTNNKERLIGSRSYIKALTGKNGTGLISTHDLELVNLEKEIPGLSNYHFKEEIIEDRMVFNYKIKKGPSPTTNALKIMRLEGLPID